MNVTSENYHSIDFDTISVYKGLVLIRENNILLYLN